MALALGVGLCTGVISPSGAVDETTTREELDRLRGQIEHLDRRIDRDRRAHEGSVEALRETELRMAASARALLEADRSITARRRELRRLKSDRTRLEESIRHHRDQLAAQIRLGYVLGRQDRIILMLNQQSPSTLARVLRYHDYFNRARAHSIGELATRLEHLDSVRDRIEIATAQLEELHHHQAELGQRLEGERAERARIVDQLAAEIAHDVRRLERLREDERRLESLVRELETQHRKSPIPDEDRPSFAKLKGRLPWPTEGAIRHAYGTARGVGGLQWQGVVIAAADGAAVNAVSHGRIAFADWLRGFGLIVIVDHGDGFMSLYGHNEVILKEVGEWVEAGESIARVGASGGAREPGLYFEIRDRGSPRNPRAWCSASQAPSAMLVSPCERPVCFASLLPAGPGGVHERFNS